MKLFVLAAALFSAHAFAGTLPEALKCNVPNAGAEEINFFDVTDLHTSEPQSSLPQAGTFDLSIGDGELNLYFSDECENTYELMFSTYALRQLKRGQVTEVTAHFEYTTVEAQKTVEAVCVLK